MYGLELLFALSELDLERTAHTLYNIFMVLVPKYMFPAMFALVLSGHGGQEWRNMLASILFKVFSAAFILSVASFSDIKLPLPAGYIVMAIFTTYAAKPSSIRNMVLLTVSFVCGAALESFSDFVFAHIASGIFVSIGGMHGEIILQYAFFKLAEKVFQFLLIYLLFSFNRYDKSLYRAVFIFRTRFLILLALYVAGVGFIVASGIYSLLLVNGAPKDSLFLLRLMVVILPAVNAAAFACFIHACKRSDSDEKMPYKTQLLVMLDSIDMYLKNGDYRMAETMISNLECLTAQKEHKFDKQEQY